MYLSKIIDELTTSVKDVPSISTWDRDWEYYNIFFAELSHKVDKLIPFTNTNAYITFSESQTPCLQFIDMPCIDDIINNRTKGDILLMHIAVFDDANSENGHSCLLKFDAIDFTQEFIDPCGFFADRGISQRMIYTALSDGFTPSSSIQRFEFETPQHVLEHETTIFKDTCGIVCVVLGLSIAYSSDSTMSFKDVSKLILREFKGRPAAADAFMSKVIKWYHHFFIESDVPLMVPALM
jgi:hypothetical protein